MALISDLLPDVMVYAPGAPEILVEQKIRDAAIELCNMSGYWQEDLDAFTTKAGDDIYDIEAPSQAVIKNILVISVDGNALDPSRMADMDLKSRSWRTQTGTPRRYVLPSMTQVMLTPIPDVEYTVTARATLRPSPDATELPDILADFQREVIADGAIFKLLSMPRRQWSDMATAAIHRQQFYRGVKQARIDANKQYTNANLFVQPKPFA